MMTTLLLCGRAVYMMYCTIPVYLFIPYRKGIAPRSKYETFLTSIYTSHLYLSLSALIGSEALSTVPLRCDAREPCTILQ